jgi:cyclopropane fatty-acyl-phospholipid synthase-like methyltransferase
VYHSLAEVYDFLVPEPLLAPEGSAAAFEMVLAELAPGARVLDCACGTGTLAVGLALRGFAVTATDASSERVARTRALADARDVEVATEVRRWEDLRGEPFDAVLCVGNSITHAQDRRAALAAMRSVARDDALLAVTSRNWERPQEAGEEVVERGGRRATVRRAWHDGDPRTLEVEVTLEGEDYAEQLAYWPFTHAELDADLRAAGWQPATSTWSPEVDRYLVTARAIGA